MARALLFLPCLLLASPAWADQRVPIAVMELAARGVDDAAAGALTTEVGNTLDEARVFRVITREDIKRMLQLEQTKQQCTGTVDAACMAEIGGALGVDYLIYGEVAKIADTYSLSLVLLNTAKAEAANRANRKISDPRQLLAEANAATKLLVQPLLADKKGYLVLDARERGAKVTVDGRLVGLTPLAGRLELPMGAHELLIGKEGFLTYAKTVDVPPSQAVVENVAMVPSQDFINEYQDRAAFSRTLAWATAGTAVAMVGTGVVLRLIGDARFDDLVSKEYLTRNAAVCAEANPGYNGTDFCPTAAGYANDVLGNIDSIETTDSIALIALIAGAASGAVSAVLFLTGEDPGRYEAFGEAKVSGALGPSGASISVSW